MAAIIQLNKKLKAHHYPIKLMGCGFVLSAVEVDPQKAWDALRAGVAEIQRIEDLISSWRDDSQTAEINFYAGEKPIAVDPELFHLIERSKIVSDITAGAFDISGTLARYYWNFNKQANAFLSATKIEELRALMDYRLIELDNHKHTVFLKAKGMKIGFGGIGKGYAAFRAHVVMQELGIESGLINASGDLMCWGNALANDTWSIQIPDPANRKQSLCQLNIPYGSVVTSGNYESYTIIDGKRYSHIVDPRTGKPVEAIKNVSVICPNPEFADAMATAISVLGKEQGLNLINRLNGIECIIIDQDDQVYYSNQLLPKVA